MKLPLRPRLSAIICPTSRYPAAAAAPALLFLQPLPQTLSSAAARRDLTAAARRDLTASPLGIGSCAGLNGDAKTSEPLRILFCGSDLFSCAHLLALLKERKESRKAHGERALIASIDVAVRPSKRTGRRYQTMVHSPLRQVALDFGLPLHELDTFTNWDLPGYINLIIAVSFSRLVPRRILAQARYGGLNVHPSLLPEYRGPAPLHHALLAGRTRTGVTLQTLHPTAYDEGTVLMQTPLAGPDALRIPPNADVPALLEITARAGADMLVRCLRNGVYLPPHVDVGWRTRRERLAASRGEEEEEKEEKGEKEKEEKEKEEGEEKEKEKEKEKEEEKEKEKEEEQKEEKVEEQKEEKVEEQKEDQVKEEAAEEDWPDETVKAPKITTDTCHLFTPLPSAAGQGWSASDAELRQRVIGPLWFMARHTEKKMWQRILVQDKVSVVDIDFASGTMRWVAGPKLPLAVWGKKLQKSDEVPLKAQIVAQQIEIRHGLGTSFQDDDSQPSSPQVLLFWALGKGDEAIYILEQPVTGGPQLQTATVLAGTTRALRVRHFKKAGSTHQSAWSVMVPFSRRLPKLEIQSLQA